MAQSYLDLEILLVDDGSPDRCGQICDEYSRRDDRVRVIHKENGGLSDARNAGLDVCTGKFVSFIDSDDYVTVDHIASLYHALKRSNSLLSVCGIVRFDDSGASSVHYQPSDVEKSVSGQEMTRTVWQPSACNKLYHRSLFETIRYPVGKLYEDLFIYHDLLAMVDHIAFTGKNSYYYYVRQGSIMNQTFDIRSLDLVEGLDLRIRKLREMRCDELADQQLPFIVDRTMDAYFKLKALSKPEKARLREIKTIFNRHYKEMLSCSGYTKAQKARISFFRYFPRFYGAVFKTGL